MKKAILVALASITLGCTAIAQQADTQVTMPINQILAKTKSFAQSVLAMSTTIPLEERIAQQVLTELNDLINSIAGVQLTDITRISNQTAQQLVQTLPQTFDRLISAAAYYNNPALAADIFITTSDLIESKIAPTTKAVLDNLSRLAQKITESNDPVDQEALASITQIFDTFFCKKFDASGCSRLGIIPQMLTIIQGQNVPQGMTPVQVLETYDITGAIRELNSHIQRAMPAIRKVIAKYLDANASGINLKNLLEQASQITPTQIAQVKNVEAELEQQIKYTVNNVK